MKINVYNNYQEISFDFQQVIDNISLQFEEEKSVSLILVDLEEIARINLEYRQLDCPTDVISFESDEEDYLGDIFICIDKVYEQAKLYKHSKEREFAFLLVHGLLHLTGFDHLNEDDEKIMFEKQEEILNKTNYRRENNERN